MDVGGSQTITKLLDLDEEKTGHFAFEAINLKQGIQYAVGQDVVIKLHRQEPRSAGSAETGEVFDTLTWKIVAIMYVRKENDKEFDPRPMVVVVPSDGKTTCYGGDIKGRPEAGAEHKKTTFPRWKIISVTKVSYVVSMEIQRISKAEQELCCRALCGDRDPQAPTPPAKRDQDPEATTQCGEAAQPNKKAKTARGAEKAPATSGTSKSDTKGVDPNELLQAKATVARLEAQVAELKTGSSEKLQRYQDTEVDLRKEIEDLKEKMQMLQELKQAVLSTYQTMNHIENKQVDKSKKVPLTETVPMSLHKFFTEELKGGK